MPKIFTMPLEASTTYRIKSNANANGITLVNDAGSAGGISVNGTAKTYINDTPVDSVPIIYAPGETQSIAMSEPGVELTIITDAGTTGKLLLVI